MHVYLARWLDRLRTGFWFVPSLMLFLAAGLALLLLHVDARVDPGMKTSVRWAYSGGPEGARSLLSTIAGSMITAASVTFSLASVALSIASQQYGSRVLRNFMRDRITQVLLGTFVSTFIYSVLVVRSIRGSDYSGFVPAVSITVAIILALISLIMLIYFVHHVSTSIQASHIVSVISEEIQAAIPKLYPASTGKPVSSLNHEGGFRVGVRKAIRIETGGYLQAIDLDALLQFATEQSCVMEILLMPGDHLVPNGEVANVWAQSEQSGTCVEKVCKSFTVGKQRTPEQDIRYPFQQLTDVIVRALSPGINDPFTAINGIDELASGISVLAQKPRVQEQRSDSGGHLRIVAPRPQIDQLLKETVGHIAIYAAEDQFVMARLHRVLKLAQAHLFSAHEIEQLGALQAELRELEK